MQSLKKNHIGFTQVFHNFITIPVEKVYLMGKKGKLNVYESYTKGLESVINRGLIRSLNVFESSDLGEQSNRISPKCQGVCYKSSETIAFPDIQHFIHNNT